MELQELLMHFNNGDTLGEDPSVIQTMRFYSREAQKITLEINNKYHEPDELAELFSKLIGKPAGSGFGMFPPFYTDFGKNITVGENVFINADCKFQDQGGIFIDDGALIGHGVVLATLNHDMDPARRQQLHPAPDPHRKARLDRRQRDGHRRRHDRRQFRRRSRRGRDPGRPAERRRGRGTGEVY